MTTTVDPLQGGIAVVTGGSGAIGSAITRALRGTGHRTVTLDRQGDIACDLASEASTRAAAAAVLEQYGRCDVFVHCAAAFDQVTINDVDAATWRHVQAVNVESALWLLQAFTPGMAERHFGRIVFIISDTFWAPPARYCSPTSPARARCSGSCGPWPPPSAPTASPCPR
jgi:NAD(P)-dependent dehydrogenase (short-subunit alcohol dehydrogenase family)